MALLSKSIDEETAELADAFDSLIAPKKLWRNHNNKLYLALRAFGAGKVGITDTALSLHHKFDPRYCEEIDLYSTAKLVGTDFRQGSGSILDITIVNTDQQTPQTLAAGIYSYQSSSGMIFSFEVSDDDMFSPNETRIISAISREKGSFQVGANASIALYREDGMSFSDYFTFSCEDNSARLGYGDESFFDFRSRILNDADRQDHIRELELAIRNLPNIFECNLVLNEGVSAKDYDGIMLAPKEMLITITGVPTGEIAKLVAGEVLYATHMVDPAQVVYYHNELYLGGKYPVYYRYHTTTEFSLSVTYSYDVQKIRGAQVENAIRSLFLPYTRMVTHIDRFGEKDAYKILEGLTLPAVHILNVDVFNSSGDETAYVAIPRTRLAKLSNLTFQAHQTGDET